MARKKKNNWKYMLLKFVHSAMVSNALKTACLNISSDSRFAVAFPNRREWATNDATVFCLVWTEVQIVSFGHTLYNNNNSNTKARVYYRAYEHKQRKNERKWEKRERNANSFMTLISVGVGFVVVRTFSCSKMCDSSAIMIVFVIAFVFVCW